MGGSCQHKSLCSCRDALEITDHVKNKIEFCIKKYMSLEETTNYLQKNHHISQNLTKLIWEQLPKESPDFFKLALQTKMFNDLLAQQGARMFEDGHIDICDSSPSTRSFLCHLPKKLATRTSSKTKPSSASSALPDANGPSVTQLPIPNDQQNQLHQYPWSSSDDLAYNSLGAPTVVPAVTDQWCPSTDPAYDILGILPPYAPEANDQWCPFTDPTYDYLGAQPPYAPAATDQWPSSTDPTYSGAQTGALAATMPEDHLTFELGGDIGHNGPSFQDTYMGLAAQQVMQPDEQLQHLNRLYQPHLQLPQNLSVETQQTLQPGGSNGLEIGEIIDQRLCHNFDTNQSMQMYTSVDQKQARGVKRRPPESKAWNDPDCDLQRLVNSMISNGMSNDKVP